MRQRFLILLAFALLTASIDVVLAEDAKKVDATNAASVLLKDQVDKVSYSFGMSIGEHLKPVPELRTNAFLAGLFAVLQDKKTLLTEAERDDLLKQFDEYMKLRRDNELTAAADKNKTDGQTFLAENAKKEGVKVLPSGLQYKIITAGSGPSPKPTDTVTIHYRGTLLNGHEFDSSYSRKVPNTVALNQVIKGWTEVLQLMNVGAKWQVYIPSELGYGRNNNIREIPPDSTLIYEIELLAIAGPAAASSSTPTK